MTELAVLEFIGAKSPSATIRKRGALMRSGVSGLESRLGIGGGGGRPRGGGGWGGGHPPPPEGGAGGQHPRHERHRDDEAPPPPNTSDGEHAGARGGRRAA